MYLTTFATMAQEDNTALEEKGLVPVGIGKIQGRETHFFCGTFSQVEEAEAIAQQVREDLGIALVITKMVKKGGK